MVNKIEKIYDASEKTCLETDVPAMQRQMAMPMTQTLILLVR